MYGTRRDVCLQRDAATVLELLLCRRDLEAYEGVKGGKKSLEASFDRDPTV